jgi:hypothetical protein
VAQRTKFGLLATFNVLKNCRWTLLGTASTWFLIDVTFYGQSLMNTTVVNNSISGVAGSTNSVDRLRYSLLSTVWIMLIALPGYWVAIAFIDRLGRWRMQMQGFIISAACFTLLAAAYAPLTARGGAAFVFVYGLTYFFANFGPNSTTFLMPVEVFPTRARATAHGLSAACGKVGATVGSVGLLALYNSFCTSSPDASSARRTSSAWATTAKGQPRRPRLPSSMRRSTSTTTRTTGRRSSRWQCRQPSSERQAWMWSPRRLVMAWALLSASSEPRVCEHTVQLQLIADVAMTFRVTKQYEVVLISGRGIF